MIRKKKYRQSFFPFTIWTCPRARVFYTNFKFFEKKIFRVLDLGELSHFLSIAPHFWRPFFKNIFCKICHYLQQILTIFAAICSNLLLKSLDQPDLSRNIINYSNPRFQGSRLLNSQLALWLVLEQATGHTPINALWLVHLRAYSTGIG